MSTTSTADVGRADSEAERPRYRPISDALAIAPTVCVVIPVKNEARNLPMVLRSLPDWVNEVVLVDGHSVDETIAVARQCRPDIQVVTQPGTGKGDALRAGFKACTSDIVVMMDGDGSTAGNEIVRFVSALVAGADYAKGSRFANSGGSEDITPGRRVGNRILSGLVNLTFGTRYTDLCYGYNALWSDCLDALNLDCGGFEIETVMNIRAAKAALRVQEIPSHELPRVHGESNLDVFFDGWRIVKAITAEALARPGPRARFQAMAAAAAVPSDSKRRAEAFLTERVSLGTPTLISVVICAHTEQRWKETCAAVQSVREQSFPNKEIIVVVDHNPALYGALAAALPDITVVENREERGLSGGKNTGVSIAKGDVVAFLDDDAVADQDWLKFFADSYAHPSVVGVGGLTLPEWKVPRPSWFPEEFDWVVGCTYRGMPESRAPVRNLLGGNASFRREVLDLVGGFQNGIGRSAGKRRPLGCEETELCIRLNQRLPGSVLLFDERAMIWHQVPAERCRLSYFHSRCYAEGLSKALVTASVGARDGLSTERRYTTKTLPSGVARGLADLGRGDVSGLGRAGAIATGLFSTVAGYVAGSVTKRVRRPLSAGAEKLAAKRMRWQR
jgi:glycosyltransferase involved in cell wall biosynthesis